MVKTYTATKFTKHVICSICHGKINDGEQYFKTGRGNGSYGRNGINKIAGKLRIESYVNQTKRKGIMVYCSNCVETIYVDGSKTKPMESLIEVT